MANEAVFDFMFDNTVFEKSIKKAGQLFSGFVKNVQKTAVSVGKGFQSFMGNVGEKFKGAFGGGGKSEKGGGGAGAIEKAVFSAGAKLAVLGTAIVSAFRFARDAVAEFVPEIGQTFTIARNIVMKNLFFPLRQAVIPELQKILKWTHEHRAMFAKWGGVLVSVLQMLKGAFSVVISLLRPLLGAITSFIKSVFGRGSITDVINIVLVKMTFLVLYLQSIIQPVFDALGKVITGVLTAVKGLVEGFVTGFLKVFNAENNTTVKALVDLLSNLGDIMIKLTPIFKSVGEVIGRVFGTQLVMGLEVIKLVIGGLKLLSDLALNPKGFDKSKEDYYNSFLDSVANVKKTFQNAFSPLETVDDAIITKDGKVIRTNPNDTIIATKGGMPGGGASINISAINITVTEGNARQAGENFIGGMQQKLRAILNTNIATEGGY